MSEHAETLKSMLQSIINNREEDAAVQIHDYFVAKTREVAGLQTQAPTDYSDVEELEDVVDADATDD
jgi:hypothetical protein